MTCAMMVRWTRNLESGSACLSLFVALVLPNLLPPPVPVVVYEITPLFFQIYDKRMFS